MRADFRKNWWRFVRGITDHRRGGDRGRKEALDRRRRRINRDNLYLVYFPRPRGAEDDTPPGHEGERSIKNRRASIPVSCAPRSRDFSGDRAMLRINSPIMGLLFLVAAGCQCPPPPPQQASSASPAPAVMVYCNRCGVLGGQVTDCPRYGNHEFCSAPGASQGGVWPLRGQPGGQADGLPALCQPRIPGVHPVNRE